MYIKIYGNEQIYLFEKCIFYVIKIVNVVCNIRQFMFRIY